MYVLYFGILVSALRRRQRQRQRFRCQARRRAVPSIGTEASESCNLPRALSLGAARCSLIIFNLLLHETKQTEFHLFFHPLRSHYAFLIVQQEIHFVSFLQFVTRPFCQFTLLSPPLSLLSLSFSSFFRCSLFVARRFIVRCCRLFRCRWLSVHSHSVKHSQRQ